MTVADAIVIMFSIGMFVLLILGLCKVLSPDCGYDEYDDCAPIYVDVDETVEEQVNLIQGEIFAEWARARSKFGPFASQHEGFAVLLEEVDELKHEVWTDGGIVRMREEAIQVAAMALRFITDVCDKVHENASDSDDNPVPTETPNIALETQTLG